MKTFSVPFTDDKRMIYAAEYLEQSGYTQIKNSDGADFVLLPIPVKKYMLGSFDNEKIISYANNEAFLLENAVLTAEGAVALLKENSNKAIYNSQVLITGYGRIAKVLHKLMNAYGAKVTVCARSDINKTEAAVNRASIITFEKLKEDNCFDFVFNTVPHMVFTKNELDALMEGAVIFDLASFPGGVDTLYAKAKEIKLVDGRALPSRYCEKSAGILIAKTVIKMTEEGLT